MLILFLRITISRCKSNMISKSYVPALACKQRRVSFDTTDNVD